MMKSRKLFVFLIFSLFTIFAFAQEAESQTETQTETIEKENKFTKGLEGKIYAQPASFDDILHSTDFVISLGPGIYVNTANKLTSAPSPIVYPITFGFIWPNYTYLAFEPTLTFFYMYHLFYNGMALPAEIENRTTVTLNFMLNLPLVFSLYYGDNRLQLNGGLGVLMRFGLKANGIDRNAPGLTGTIQSDISEINKWFWSNARFLYLSAGASWLFGLTGNLKAGPTVNIYFPVGTIFSHENIQGMIATVGMKVSL